MPAELLDGKAIAQTMRTRLRAAREQLGSRPIRLVSVEVGQNPAAAVYLRNQQRAAAEVGIEMDARHLPIGTSEAELIAAIGEMNRQPEVAGILVQRPLPPGIDPRHVQSAIDPHKDVEGMHPANMGAILYRGLSGQPPFRGPLIQVLHAIAHREPPPPSSLRPEAD
ncbi:MAG: bifunctional methylenetetrahydrofolate dehydrogenase/methenyltetrahydrofolate cyclohydrolase, partial [Planctomycetes bacterium]|nr:bifunctional methylenetetrahydrofolate dehydrogenase/methenyltetrahydrofolate cyclohydrolase [Planctomycetota bacterium]